MERPSIPRDALQMAFASCALRSLVGARLFLRALVYSGEKFADLSSPTALSMSSRMKLTKAAGSR